MRVYEKKKLRSCAYLGVRNFTLFLIGNGELQQTSYKVMPLIVCQSSATLQSDESLLKISIPN